MMQDYAAICGNFRLEVPEHFNFAADVVDRWAEDPARKALHWVNDGLDEEIVFTYTQMRDLSFQAMRLLKRLGLKKGDRVCLLSPRIPQWWILMTAMIRSGIVPIPGTTQLTSKDIHYRVTTSEAKAIIADSDNAAKVDAIRGQCPTLDTKLVIGGPHGCWEIFDEEIKKESSAPLPSDTKSDDPCLIYFTSGTTGYPKMVLHTQVSYPLAHRITGEFWLDLKPSDLHWNLSDNGWAKAAWSSLFAPWNMGSCIFVQDGRGKFDPKAALEILGRYGITTFCAPPTAYRMLVHQDIRKDKLKKLRHCVSAGEPLNPEVMDIWKEKTGLMIRDGYGQTESVLLVGTFPFIDVKPGSMGKPSPGFDVNVIDDAGHVMSDDKEGDIAVRVKPQRPVGLFQEYWKDAQETQARLRGDWYITGDRAIRDIDGYLWFVGRADDVILSAGYRIGPFEVESALLEHPAVLESAVVASPDATRGEIVKAFVILKPGVAGNAALIEELQTHVKTVTAPYKYPREIEFVNELPKTVSGKIRRVDLREKEKKKKV